MFHNEEATITLTYVIGQEKPTTVTVNSFGTGEFDDRTLAEIVTRAFDLRISSVIEHLQLKKPIYGRLAAYGHFGRTELNLPWKNCDMVGAILNALYRIMSGEGKSGAKNGKLIAGESEAKNADETCGGGGTCGKE